MDHGEKRRTFGTGFGLLLGFILLEDRHLRAGIGEVRDIRQSKAATDGSFRKVRVESPVIHAETLRVRRTASVPWYRIIRQTNNADPIRSAKLS